MDYFYRFSSLLSMNWMFYADLNHMIYLYNPQSQNNKWDRRFKLKPSVSYRNGGFSNKLSTSVLANYSVYDFDEQLPLKTSFIIRRYSLSDSLMIPVYKRFSFVLLGRIELEDKGNFFEKEFEQKVVQSYRSHLLNIHIMNKSILNMRISAGYSTFVRRNWRHLPVKRLSRRISNNGPFINIAYRTTPNLLLSAYVAFSTFDDSNLKKTRDSKGHLKLYYNF
jgi:hypothetical protein